MSGVSTAMKLIVVARQVFSSQKIRQECDDAPRNREVEDGAPGGGVRRQAERFSGRTRDDEQNGRAGEHRRSVECGRVQPRAVALGREARGRRARRAGKDGDHRPDLRRVGDQSVSEERDDAAECGGSARQRLRRQSFRLQVEMGGKRGHHREHGKDDGREPAVEPLLAPVDEAVVPGEEHRAHPEHEPPFRAAVRPPCTERRHERDEHPARDEKAQRRRVERLERAVADLDDEPGRAPDETEKREQERLEELDPLSARLVARRVWRRTRSPVGPDTS